MDRPYILLNINEYPYQISIFIKRTRRSFDLRDFALLNHGSLWVLYLLCLYKNLPSFLIGITHLNKLPAKCVMRQFSSNTTCSRKSTHASYAETSVLSFSAIGII